MKKVGTAFGNFGKLLGAGLGIGLIVGLFTTLKDMLGQNQKVVDAVNIVFQSLSIVLNTVVNAVTDTFNSMSEMNGGFDATIKVLDNLLTIGIAPFKLAIIGLQAVFYEAQLAWEQSFLGGGDEDKIEELERKLSDLGEEVVGVVDDVVEAGGEIGDNIAEAYDEVSSTVVAISETVISEIDKIDVKATITLSKNLEARRKAFELSEIQGQALIEQYDLEAETLRQTRDDDLLAIEDRIKANEELGDVLLEKNAEEKANIQSRIDFLNDEERLLGENFERQKEIAALKVELSAVDAAVAGLESEQLANRNALIREQIELRQLEYDSAVEEQFLKEEIALSNEENEILRAEKEIELEQKKIDAKKVQYDRDVALYKEGTVERARIDADYNKEKLLGDAELAKKEKALEKLKTDTKINNAQAGLSAISGLLGEFAEESKGAASAQIVIDSLVAGIGIWRGYASMGPFGIGLAAVQTAALAVSTAKALQKVNAVSPDSTPTPPSPSDTGGTGVSTNVPDIVSRNQEIFEGLSNQGNNINNSIQTPTRAYILSEDIKSQEELNRRIESDTTL